MDAFTSYPARERAGNFRTLIERAVIRLKTTEYSRTRHAEL